MRAFSYVFTQRPFPAELQEAVARLLPPNPFLLSPHVDKTSELADLYTSVGRKVVFTRPPSFGKSTALQVLLHLHCGPLQFLESALDLSLQPERGRWLASTNYRHMTHSQVRALYELTPLEFRLPFPVLYFDLAPFETASAAHLRQYLLTQSQKFSAAYAMPTQLRELKSDLRELLVALPAKVRELPAVFVDNFDAPLRDRWDPAFPERLAVLRDLGEAFQAEVKLVFCAGNSVDPELLDQSSWTAFEDITEREKYATLCGFTWTEVARCFAAQLAAAQAKYQLSAEQLRSELHAWYGGYHFGADTSTPLFCPLSITRFASTGVLQGSRGTAPSLHRVLQTHPAVLTSTQLYEPRKDSTLLQAGHDFNHFDLNEALGLLFRLGLLAPSAIAFPRKLFLQVANKSAAEVLARTYLYCSCAVLWRRLQAALTPFQLPLFRAVLQEGRKHVSMQALAWVLATLGSLDGLGEVRLGADYVDLQVQDSYLLRVNFGPCSTRADFNRPQGASFAKVRGERGVQLAFSSHEVKVLAYGELPASGQLPLRAK